MATVLNNDHDVESGSPPPDELENGVYDRSSLTGDYMVMIDGQTADDFEKYAPEMQFCDYFDGVVYMPSPVTDRHQEQTGFLYFLVQGFCCERGGNQVLLGPAVLRLTPEWKPEPDLFVRPPAAASAPQPPALLVVEIHSRSTHKHDLGRKRDAYRAVGIPNIWMLDDRAHVLRVDTRMPGDGQYHERTLSEGRLDVAELPGFWIDVAWLWMDPLPNRRRCLDQILQGPPAPLA